MGRSEASQSTQGVPTYRGVHAVTDTYSKAELDAKLALDAERAARASDGIAGKVDRVLDAIAAIGKDLADFKKDARADASALRIEVRDDYKNTRNTLIGVAVGAVGIVLAIIALTYGMAGNMTTANGNVLAAFGAGGDAKEAVHNATVAATPAPLYDAQTGKRLAAP